MNFLENMLNSIGTAVGDFLPSTVGALLIIIIGWFLANGLKRLMTRLLKRTGIDNRLKPDKITLSKFVGKLVYFLVMIFVLMLALEKLGMQRVLDPVKNLLNGFMAFVPNIIGAGLVAYIGYMLAMVVSEFVEMSGSTLNNFISKLGISTNIDLVGILKKVVFMLIFIPLLIAALNILDMTVISEPATSILIQFFDAIPKVVLAIFILLIFSIGGRYLAQLVKDLLDKFNLNGLADKMYLSQLIGKTDLAKLLSNVVYFFIAIFGLVTAVEKLQFTKLTKVLDTLINVSGSILFGLFIVLIGNWISLLAMKAFSKNGQNSFVAAVIRIAVLAIFLAMGLKTMGMADDIVNLAFGITLGTIAATVVLSFGLGGREAGGKQMEKILNRFNTKE